MTDTTAWITRYATASQQAISEAGALLEDASRRINNGTFGSEQCAKSASDLLNLAVTTSLEWVQAVQSIWKPLSTEEVELSAFIDATPDSTCERVLSVAKPFRRVGAPSDVIGTQSLVFVPGILRVHATRFRVGVRGQDYYSGTYRGSIRLTGVQAGAALQREMDVTIDL